MNRRSLIMVVLTLPFVSGVIATMWGFVIWGDFTQRARIWYGVIPWLEAEWHIGVTWHTTHRINIIGLISLVGVTLFVAFLLFAGVLWLIQQADIRDRCRHCGYPIATPSRNCSECGHEYENRLTHAERRKVISIPKPLLRSIVLLTTIPGIGLWIGLIARWRMGTTIPWFGSAAGYELLALPVTVAVAFVSLTIGSYCLFRYRREYIAGDSRGPVQSSTHCSPM